jgi:hypothetical protein
MCNYDLWMNTTKVRVSFILSAISTHDFVMYSNTNNGYTLRYVFWNNNELHVEDRRGHTKETGNRYFREFLSD